MATTAASGVPFWLDVNDPLAWDTVILGGDVWPGLADVSGSGVVRKIDVKKGKGNDGATIKDEGNELAKLTITLTIYNETDWQLLQTLLPKIHPRQTGGPRQPIEIIHPKAALLGIKYIYVTSVPFPDFNKKDQILTLTIEAIEFAPAPRAAKKAAGKTETDEIKSTSRVFGDVEAQRVDEDGFHVSPADAAEEGFGEDAVKANLVS